VRFAFIAEEARLGVVRLCRALEVSRAGYYAWRKRPPSEHGREDEQLKVHVKAIHARSRATYR